MSFEFPFEYAVIPGMGKLFYPIVYLELKTIRGWYKFEFLVDTGADVTTLPLHLLPVLDIDKQSCKVSRTLGVGGITTKTWEFFMPIRIGSIELNINASAVESPDDSLPLLLGRKDIFESKFNLLIDSRNKKTVITKNT